MTTRKKVPEQPCSCHEHLNDCPTEFPGHRYSLRHDSGKILEWHWRCSCGRSGRDQGQAPSVSYHQWRAHLVRSRVS